MSERGFLLDRGWRAKFRMAREWALREINHGYLLDIGFSMVDREYGSIPYIPRVIKKAATLDHVVQLHQDRYRGLDEIRRTILLGSFVHQAGTIADLLDEYFLTHPPLIYTRTGHSKSDHEFYAGLRFQMYNNPSFLYTLWNRQYDLHQINENLNRVTLEPRFGSRNDFDSKELNVPGVGSFVAIRRGNRRMEEIVLAQNSESVGRSYVNVGDTYAFVLGTNKAPRLLRIPVLEDGALYIGYTQYLRIPHIIANMLARYGHETSINILLNEGVQVAHGKRIAPTEKTRTDIEVTDSEIAEHLSLTMRARYIDEYLLARRIRERERREHRSM